MQGRGKVQRRLTAELNDDAQRLFGFDNIQHILSRQRLEIQLVGGIIIRTDGFGVAVDHDAFNSLFSERKRGMDTAVIKFDSLADPVGAAAQDHHFFPV